MSAFEVKLLALPKQRSDHFLGLVAEIEQLVFYQAHCFSF